MASSCLVLGKTLCLVLLYVQACACGEAEIIGGQKVKAHSLPYMALLLDSKGHPVCGGTLLSSRWVLTTAQACSFIDSVRLGVDSIEKSKTDKSVQVRKVADSYIHDKYDGDKHLHDLQLLLLDKEAEQTTVVKYLPLADVVPDPQEGTECLVAGWGVVNVRTGARSDVLMSANVMVIKRETCNSRTYYNRHPVITEDMVCAGYLGDRVTDTCQGDSGGPLMCNGVQVGITSFGDGCGIETKPGVYALLSKDHIAWIKKTMRKQEFF